jgi:hypothetical protein
MKIRNHRKYEWWFRPDIHSKLKKKLYKFKYKADLIKFLNNNIEQSLNGEVTLEHNCFNSSSTFKSWVVWYSFKNSKLKIELKRELHRGSKYIFKPRKISKESKKWFAFSDKVYNLMCNIYEDDCITILPEKAKKLTEIFYKRGFKDFEPNQEDWDYINYYINKGRIDFGHWSDRCNFLRTKTIIEFFKIKNLI